MAETEKRYESEILAAVHETAADLAAAGLIDKRTMRDFDALCLTPIEPLSAEEIRQIREKEKVSQALFATYLNVTISTIGQWERGEKSPAGASLKLLSLVRKKGLEAIA
jgi:putative transcriptional regulator